MHEEEKDLITPGVRKRSQMKTTPNQNTGSSKGSKLEDKYLDVNQSTGSRSRGRLVTNDALSDKLTRTPDTDLRREIRHQNLPESPDPISKANVAILESPEPHKMDKF